MDGNECIICLITAPRVSIVGRWKTKRKLAKKPDGHSLFHLLKVSSEGKSRSEQ